MNIQDVSTVWWQSSMRTLFSGLLKLGAQNHRLDCGEIFPVYHE
jgi:hypothetical protein